MQRNRNKAVMPNVFDGREMTLRQGAQGHRCGIRPVSSARNIFHSCSEKRWARGGHVGGEEVENRRPFTKGNTSWVGEKGRHSTCTQTESYTP